MHRVQTCSTEAHRERKPSELGVWLQLRPGDHGLDVAVWLAGGDVHVVLELDAHSEPVVSRVSREMTGEPIRRSTS